MALLSSWSWSSGHPPTTWPHGKECALRRGGSGRVLAFTQQDSWEATGSTTGNTRSWRCTVRWMAYVCFDVLYNDEGRSALRVQLAGPIVLTGLLLRYSMCSLEALLCSLPEQTESLLVLSALQQNHPAACDRCMKTTLAILHWNSINGRWSCSPGGFITLLLDQEVQRSIFFILGFYFASSKTLRCMVTTVDAAALLHFCELCVRSSWWRY